MEHKKTSLPSSSILDNMDGVKLLELYTEIVNLILFLDENILDEEDLKHEQ